MNERSKEAAEVAIVEDAAWIARSATTWSEYLTVLEIEIQVPSAWWAQALRPSEVAR